MSTASSSFSDAAGPAADDAVARAVRAQLGAGGPVHLVGVAGVGMAGLARLLRARGLAVSGCDLRPEAAGWLAGDGVALSAGHDPAHLGPGVAWVVRSAAVPDGCPELAAARARGLPVFARGEVLPELLAGRRSVAVGGTHGKTTTTTFVARILERAGLDPAWCIGGDLDAPGSLGRAGAGDAIVVEADESDGTLARYRPDVAVITNIEFDHMEHFAGVEAFEDCFRRFAAQARRALVIGADDPRAAALAVPPERRRSFGFDAGADLRAADVELGPDRIAFTVVPRGAAPLGRLALPVPGRHNVLNALAATAAALELGVDFAVVQAALAAAALPRRRFERVAARGGVTVINDYAHHPSEVAALVRTARGLPHARLLAVFQPHRYTRTRALGADFPPAFDGIDALALAPVYAASEPPLPGGTAWDLYARFRERAVAGGPRVCVAGGLAPAWGYLRRELRAGDVLLVVGAGDVAAVARWAAEDPALGAAAAADPAPPALPGADVRADAPLAARTTLRVGGRADLFARAADEAGLAALLAWAAARGVPVRVLGAGSNVLVADTGVRGLVVRLVGPAFRAVREEDGLVVAGAGLSTAALLGRLEAAGWSGLEFLHGIPASVGGALAMNAGAWGAGILDRAEWIRCLNADGAPAILSRADFQGGYRRSAGLQGRVAVAAAFRLDRASPAAVAARRRECAARRRIPRGLRCAGSAFRNPPGEAAGRLLERAGLKGARVGGAAVWDGHANVIATAPGATASDVRALMEKMRDEVARKFAVDLEPEIRLWE